MNELFKKVIDYKKGEVADQGSLNYIKKNGVFKVKFNKIFGFGSQDDRSTFARFDMQVVGTDDLIVAKELLTYTDKNTGNVVETKGMNLIRAAVGMASNTGKASAKWTPCVEKNNFTNESIQGAELKKLVDKVFYVKVQVERSTYNSKAREANKINRLFSADKLSLGEYEDALDAVTNGDIKSLSEYDAVSIINASKPKKQKYSYSKCTREEWEALSDSPAVEDSDTGDNPSEEALPSLDANTSDTLPPAVEEKPKQDDAAPTDKVAEPKAASAEGEVKLPVDTEVITPTDMIKTPEFTISVPDLGDLGL